VTQRSPLLLPLVAALGAAPLAAGGTSIWRVQSAASFAKGELENVVVSSEGDIVLGLQSARTTSDEIGIWSSCVARDGTPYFGTGNRGRIVRFRDGALETVHETGDVAVSALAASPDGPEVFAGTLSEGRILRVSPDGTATEVARIEDGYVWTLLAAPDGVLYAGTGEEGRVVKIDRDGAVSVLYDSKDDHVLSLALAPDGSLFAGTTFEGLLYRIAGDGAAAVVHDFAEDEVRALHVSPPYLVVATNRSKRFKPKTFVQRLKRSVEKGPGEGEEERSPFQELFDGVVYRMHLETGVLERLHEFSKTYAIDAKGESSGDVLVATGDEGRVYRVRPDGTVFTLLDLDEKQAMTLSVVEGSLAFVGTGNAGNVYRIAGERARRGTYTSEVLDGRFRCKWGTLEWLGEGRLSFQARSGNTALPDDLWSPWSAPQEGRSIAVTSPPGRFLQFRVVFEADPAAVLRSVQIAYLADNQRPRVLDLQVSAGDPAAPYRGEAATSREVDVDWKAEDPDGDPLVYDVHWRREGSDTWVKANREEALTKRSLKVDAATLSDGWYSFRVSASDRGANPAGRALAGTRTSSPILVDNRKPEIASLRAEAGGSWTITGVAQDSFSNVARLEYSLDGGTWTVVYPEDELLDRSSEPFRFHLPDPSPGAHSLAVRAFDARGNVGVGEISFQVEKK